MSEEKHRVVCNLCRKAKSPWFPTDIQADNWVTKNGWTWAPGEDGNIVDACPDCSEAKQ